jgi:redox-sensitive bicupin YhaK (pirin superfamily)
MKNESVILKRLPLDPEGGVAPWPTIDPFLFCVHHLDVYPRGNGKMGPDASLAGRELGQDFQGKDGWRMYHGEEVPGFPAHPHRGFETVTVMRRGFVDHSDSLGAAARYGRGDVQWLTAGGGIQHSEMFPLLDDEKTNPAELFQIWMNLPGADKHAPPFFSMLWNETIPRVSLDGGRVEVTVIAGELEGKRPPSPPPHSWASRPEADVAIWSIVMKKGGTLTLPASVGADTLRTLYYFAGAPVAIGGERLDAFGGAVVMGHQPLTLEAPEGDAEVLVLQGRPIGEPVAQYGPFVMNTRAEIQQAFADYQRMRRANEGFGAWPWKSDDPVHAREEGRFARQPDGTIERR